MTIVGLRIFVVSSQSKVINGDSNNTLLVNHISYSTHHSSR